MRVLFLIVLATFLLGSGPAAQPQSFDLICTGKRYSGSSTVEDFSQRYRINISAMRWCWEKCTETSDLVSATESELVLENGMIRSTVHKSTSINRQTGKLFVDYRSDIMRFSEIADCEKGNFSGFPTNKF
jgi:hypothetical protein